MSIVCEVRASTAALVVPRWCIVHPAGLWRVMKIGRRTWQRLTASAAFCALGLASSSALVAQTPTAEPVAELARRQIVSAAERDGIKPLPPVSRESASDAAAAPALQVPVGVDPLPLNPDRLRPESELHVWWSDAIRQPFGDPQQALPIELNPAVVQALTHSAHVAVLRETAAIACTSIVRAEANFDALRFAESRFTDTSDPVGNTLTTGGAPRFIDETWYANAGLRRRTLTGAQLEMSQRLGYQNNNSLFFVPKNQATARLNISLTQPLLRGAGTCYNNSVIVLARIDADLAHDQFSADMQAYLVDLHKAFWDIYLQRAGYVQRRRLLLEAQEVLAELEARKHVDVLSTQLARARAAVATREVAVFKFEAAAKNGAARFKSLVNDPFLDQACVCELIPINPPDACYGDADLCVALATALDSRPEIHQATRSLRAASTRLNVSNKDLLPMLNVVLGAYASGLQGQSDFSNAIGDQFSVGRPTYWGGLTYEVPWGNRAAKAQFQARQLELKRAGSQLQAVAATIRAEVEIAARDVTTTCREVRSKYQAMLAEQQEVELLLERWRSLAGDQQVAGIVLNDLLDAQDRRASAELDMVGAQVSHRIAWIQLKRATGTLCDLTAVTGNEALLPAVEPPPPSGFSGDESSPAPARLPPVEKVPAPSGERNEPRSPSDKRPDEAPRLSPSPAPPSNATSPTTSTNESAPVDPAVEFPTIETGPELLSVPKSLPPLPPSEVQSPAPPTIRAAAPRPATTPTPESPATVAPPPVVELGRAPLPAPSVASAPSPLRVADKPVRPIEPPSRSVSPLGRGTVNTFAAPPLPQSAPPARPATPLTFAARATLPVKPSPAPRSQPVQQAPPPQKASLPQRSVLANPAMFGPPPLPTVTGPPPVLRDSAAPSPAVRSMPAPQLPLAPLPLDENQRELQGK
ncbi:MAG: TolC family protein [Planctomycetaceae bacterium]|nr:TolC family protein [Planctomycetaceae bacterium]